MAGDHDGGNVDHLRSCRRGVPVVVDRARRWASIAASTATVVLLALVMTRSGAWLLRVGGLSTLQARLPAALIVGLVALAVPMTGWVLFSNLSVLGALCATGLTVMTLGYGGSRRVPHAPPPDRADLLFAALACISILVFARVAITLPALH